jgi:phage shock protein E
MRLNLQRLMNWTLLILVAGALVGLMVLKRMSFVSADKACQLLQQGGLVIDVRSPDEFRAGHLPGAINLPLGTLSNDLPRRVPDKNQVLLLHCLSGTRSGMAKQQLKGMGYLNAFNLGSYDRAEKIMRQAKKD